MKILRLKLIFVLVSIIAMWERSSGSPSGTMSFFPFSRDINWESLNPSAIECHAFGHLAPMDDSIKISGYKPVLKKENTVSGYLCTKIALYTKCDSPFVGSPSLEHFEHHPKASELECLNAIVDFKKGSIVTLDHPPPSCSWLTSSTTLKEIIKIEKSDMSYDPYSKKIISTLFPKGYCQSSFCEMIDAGHYWLPDHNTPPSCNPDHFDRTFFLYKALGGKGHEIWSPDSLVDASLDYCKLDYCGVPGILLSNHDWIGARVEDQSHPNTLMNFYKVLKSCNETSRIGGFEETKDLHVAESNLLDVFLQEECEKTREELILGNPISRTQLQSLTPRRPGRGKVYRLNNQTIEMGISDYKAVHLIQPVGIKNLIARDINGEPVYWNYWTKDDSKHILDGPNGLFIYKSKLEYYLQGVNEYKSGMSLNMKELIEFDPKRYGKPANDTADFENILYNKVGDPKWNGASLLMGSSFKRWVFFIFIIVVGLISFKVLTRLIILGRKYKAQNVVAKYNKASELAQIHI